MSKYRGQDNPRDQIRVILGSIEMDQVNIKNITYPDVQDRKTTILDRIQKQTQDLKKLIDRYMSRNIPWGEDEDTLDNRIAKKEGWKDNDL